MSDADDEVLIVAMCAGPRCHALRHRLDDQLPIPDPLAVELRRAIAGRAKSVLLSTPCQGGCAQACVVIVGYGVLDRTGRLRWTGEPTRLTSAEVPGRPALVADWLSSAAPERASMPR